MDEQPISTKPPSVTDRILKEKFAETIAAQSEQMDKLGQQLITLEPAIPGLYATVLKLVNSKPGSSTPLNISYLAFLLWLIALGLTLRSLTPKEWDVDPNIMIQDPLSRSNQIGIEDFFYRTAKYKRCRLIAACLFFFTGIFFAALSLF